MSIVLYLVFILSGAAGLIYESIWSRYLGLFVGHSAYAQIIVLVIFLGGMSIGAMLAGRRSHQVKEPLLWYAAVELIVGLIGLAFHDIYGAVTSVAYDGVFPALAGGPALLIVKWIIAGLLILPQSILLGATFPLMGAGAIRRLSRGAAASEPPGRVLALLYFANSLGAAVGVLLAGFWLIRVAGLPGTLLVAAMVNIVVAVAIYVATRMVWPSEAEASAVRDEGAAAPPAPAVPVGDERPIIPQWISSQMLWRLLLAVSFGTAVASFTYEIAWIRMLSLVLGSATHSFELMLSAFILGLALGSFWARSRVDRFRDPILALGIVQWLMGIFAVATLPLYIASFGWTADLLAALQTSSEGYRLFTLARYGISLAVMLPATFMAGITLPLITRTLLRHGTTDDERAIGWVYGVNTLGSIVGVALAGLVLLPLLGLKLLLILGASLDIALGVILVAIAHREEAERAARWGAVRVPAGVVVATALLVGVIAIGARFDYMVLTSGVFRSGQLPTAGTREITFYEDGRTATVSVRKVQPGGGVSLTTNGKPDASLGGEWFDRDSLRRRYVLDGDESTQMMVAILSMAYAPNARTAAVVGQGSGMTSHILLASPSLERLETIEIEPQMIAGSRAAFFPANRRVFEDPRHAFIIDDAKSHFAAAGRRYDLIISEPSNPWVSGVSGLFTSEFYGRVRRYLADDGIFGQWLHLYEIDDALVLSVLAALHEHFPSYAVYLVAGHDLLIVASGGETLPRPDWSITELPGVRDDLRHVVPLAPEHLKAMWMFDRSSVAPAIEMFGYPNSDFYPILDLTTERTRYQRQHARGFSSLGSERFDLVSALEGRRTPFATYPLAPVPSVPRLRNLSLGVRLRTTSTVHPLDSALYVEPVVDAMRFRRQLLEAIIASGRAPEDWKFFIRLVRDVENDIHAGTAGVVDEAFYATVRRYLASMTPPPEAVAAVDLLHGLAAWNWREAAAASERLLPAAQRGEEWVEHAMLLDGGVVSHLALGDTAGARRFVESLSRRSGRQAGDLRLLMLEARVGESAGEPRNLARGK